MPKENQEEEEEVLAGVWSHLGMRVRQLRQEQELTQHELATRLSAVGVYLHQSTIAKLEAGTRPTVVHEVWALARVLEVDYDELLPEWRDPGQFAAEEHLRALADARATLSAARKRLAYLRQDGLYAEAEVQRLSREVFELETMYPGIAQASGRLTATTGGQATLSGGQDVSEEADDGQHPEA